MIRGLFRFIYNVLRMFVRLLDLVVRGVFYALLIFGIGVLVAFFFHPEPEVPAGSALVLRPVGTIVEQAERILPSPELMEPLRESLRTQLEDAGVRFVLGARLGYLPPVDVGIHQPFVVETTTGEKIEADIWFRAYGNRAESDALDGTLAAVRRGDGSIRVDGHLRVAGHGTVWAIGDVADVKESKRAQHAIAHARVVAENLRSVLAGGEPTVLYRPEPEIVVIPLGPEGGASQVMKRDGSRVVLDAHETSRIKGQDLMVGPVKEMLGVE